MKKTIKPYNRLRLGCEFAYVRGNGVKYVGRLMILVIAESAGSLLKCGVVCGKKYCNKAVVRNRARRMVWETLRLLKSEIEPCRMVVIPRKNMAGRSQPEVHREMVYLLKKARMMLSDQY